VHTIVLAGSVLPPRFPWKHLFVRGLLTRVINDCGTRDGSLVLSKLFILGTGHAGRAGFQGMTGSHLVNRFFQFGHSGYFLLKTQPSDTFMQLRWVDVLLTEAAVQPIDERPPLTFTRGVFEVLVNNAELAKVAAYIVFLTCGLLFVNHVVVAAKQDLARKRAATAMQDMERDLVAALPLALKALDTAPIVESKGALIFALANGDKIDAFLERSAEPMYCVAFSLNGSLLAYTSDRSVKLWRHTPSWEGLR
jgi:hypothetical protein